MSTFLLKSLLFIALLSSCVSSSHNNSGRERRNIINNTQAVTASFEDIDTASVTQLFTSDKTPVSLTELPRTEEGAYVLSPGFYEADFKTYCLQPGTPAPSANDVYFQAPLRGYRKDIIETVLRNSQKESHLDQKNIQLLLWAVVSRSDFSKLSSSVQYTARQLLSSKQIFELRGGMVGAAKTVVKVLPSTGVQNNLQKLFDLGTSSYDTYERLAVLNAPSEIRRPGFKRDQWLKVEDGYYVRYYPNSYKQTKIQVYVPAGVADSAGRALGNYVVFDPVSMLAVPANSNAQRLGVGGPVEDIVRSVIHTIGSGNGRKHPNNKNEEKKPGSIVIKK
jgi:hypothetical protein